MIEAQVKYVMQALSYKRERGIAALEPSADAQARFSDEIDEGTKGSVWTAGGCLSWYVDATGRNSTLWPGSIRAYQRRVARFEPDEYEVLAPRPGQVPEPVAA